MEISSPSGACTLLWHAMQCSEVAKRRCPGGSAPGGVGGSAARLKLTIKPVRAVTKPKAPVRRRRFLVLRIIRICFAAPTKIHRSTKDIASIETNCVLLALRPRSLFGGRREADFHADFFNPSICHHVGSKRRGAFGARGDRRECGTDAARRARDFHCELRD